MAQIISIKQSRKLYQSNKVGDNLELPSHLIAGKGSPFLGWWRFLSPLHAALRPLTADIQNITRIPLVAWWFLTVSSGVVWLDTAGPDVASPYRTCLFHDLHYFKVSPIQDEQLKSQPYLNLVLTEAHFSLFFAWLLDRPARVMCTQDIVRLTLN